MFEPTSTVVLIASAVLAAGSVAALAWRERPEPGAASLAALMLVAATWSGTHLAGLLAETLAGTLFWVRLQWFASVALPVTWLLFALEYTGRDKYVRPSVIVGLSILPAITLVLLWTNASHGLVREVALLTEQNGHLVLESTWGPWFPVIVGYAYLLVAIGSLLFAQLAIGSPLLYRGQAAALLVGAVVPWLSHLVYLSDLTPWASLDLVGISFTVSGGVLLVALSRVKLLEATPAAGRLASEFVIDGIDDGVVVTDSRGYVVDCNPSAAAMLGVSQTDAVGRPVDTVVPGGDVREDAEVTTEVGDTTRYFDVRTSVLEDYHGRAVGHAIVLRDVTERRLARQRLAVLHRILRHNLRNEMTVIRGHADRLEGDERGASAIERSATRVIDLSDKAAQLQRIAEGADESTTVRLGTAIIDSVRSLEPEHPETTFHTHALPDVTCDSRVETAVYNLIENAAEHNTNDGPRVTIEATVEDERLRITVGDNGPGIPPIERRVLESEGETPLQHGSGIGLWLVNWIVDSLAGTIEFAENEPAGSLVTVRVPTVDTDD